MMSDYAIKIQSLPDHPAAHIMEDCWQLYYGKYDTDRKVFSDEDNKGP